MSNEFFCGLRGLICICLGLVSMVIVANATECKDIGKLCWWWSYMKWCKQGDTYSREKCPKRCNFCPSEPPLSTTQSSLSTTINSVTTQVTPLPTHVTPSVTTPPSNRPESCELPELPFSRHMVDDMYIVGNILRAHAAVSEIQCEDFCLRAHNCLGFNYNFDCVGKNNCELLDHVETFKPKTGYRFRLLDREYAKKSILNPCY